MAAPNPAFPGPIVKPRDDIPNMEKIKKPGILTTITSVSGGLGNYMNAGVFPISGQEPLTEMQRKTEMFEFSHLLDKAAKAAKESTERLLLVTAFNIFGWTGACLRTDFKAMRPMDSETFDFVSPELGFTFVIEYVKLHEDNRYSSNSQAFGKGWSLSAESCATVTWQATMVLYNGNYAAELKFDDGDTYVLSMPAGHASGVATGNPVFTYDGAATVEHIASGRGSEVDLTEPSMLSMGKKHRVKGYLVDSGKKTGELKITGTWDSQLGIVWKDGREETLATYKVTGPATQNKYKMPHLAVQLNHFPDALAKVLPPTDARRRLDLHYLEKGLFNEAEEERSRLLALRDERREAGSGSPRWFSPRAKPIRAGPEGKLLTFQYAGGYWEARLAAASIGQKAWKGCSDIFGLAS